MPTNHPVIRAALIGSPDPRLLKHLPVGGGVDLVRHYDPQGASLDKSAILGKPSDPPATLWLINTDAPVEVLDVLTRANMEGGHVALVGPRPRLDTQSLVVFRHLQSRRNLTILPWCTERFRLDALPRLLEMTGPPDPVELMTGLSDDGSEDPLDGLREPLDALLYAMRGTPTSVAAATRLKPDGSSAVYGRLTMTSDGGCSTSPPTVEFEARWVAQRAEEGFRITLNHGNNTVEVVSGGDGDPSRRFVWAALDDQVPSWSGEVATPSPDEADGALVECVVAAVQRAAQGSLVTDPRLPTPSSALTVARALERIRLAYRMRDLMGPDVPLPPLSL